VVSYLLFILPTTILVFGLNFLNRYAFLRTSAGIFDTIRLIGVVMISIGGIWTATQEHLKRAFGYSALVEIGFSLLAIGLSAEGGLRWMLMLFTARALGYWLWGYTLTRLESHYDTLDFKSIQGCARKYPLLASGLLLAQLSIAGLPLLASFPIKITLLTQAISLGGSLGLWGFIGNLGLFLFTIRLLLSVVTSTESEPIRLWGTTEKSSEYLPILVLVFILIIIGLFPHTFLAGITNILTVFPQLQ